MKTKSKAHHQPTLAATVCAEDIACGDYVALLNETVDVPTYLWDGYTASLSPHELVRLKLIPHDAGQPLKVIAVCLPFVYAKTPSGALTTIDTRRIQLVRLDRRCAKLVCKQLLSTAKGRR
jgi:hypothetical protein